MEKAITGPAINSTSPSTVTATAEPAAAVIPLSCSCSCSCSCSGLRLVELDPCVPRDWPRLSHPKRFPQWAVHRSRRLPVLVFVQSMGVSFFLSNKHPPAALDSTDLSLVCDNSLPSPLFPHPHAKLRPTPGPLDTTCHGPAVRQRNRLTSSPERACRAWLASICACTCVRLTPVCNSWTRASPTRRCAGPFSHEPTLPDGGCCG